MAVDYDLVVIGSSWSGIYAAHTAAHLQARVALVTQTDAEYLDRDFIVGHCVNSIARRNWAEAQNIFSLASKTARVPVSLSTARAWGNMVDETLRAENYSLTTLAALGVDVIRGKGEFCRLPKLALNVGKRQLRSRNYLLATGARFVHQSIDDDSSINCPSIDALWQLQDLTSLPERLVIIGNYPRTLEVAQSLARFGKQVILIVTEQRILPQEDREISQLIQAQLESEGIKIISNAPVSQIKIIDRKKWLQVGNKAIETDEIIWGNYQQPNIDGLNLAGVNVKYNFSRVIVNQKLQTTNRRIYACGEVIGGYSSTSLAQYEANITLKNTLFIPWFKTNYFCIPWGVAVDPHLARVGMNERQARKHYGDDIYIVRKYFKSVTQAQITEATTGVCKLIINPGGEILGCTVVGDRAPELIGTIALAMKHKIKFSNNPMQGLTDVGFPHISPSLAEIWQQAAIDFYQQKLKQNQKLFDRLGTWFNIRRDWNK